MNRIFGKEEDRYYININLNNRRFFRDQKEKDKVESLGHKAAELFLEQIEKISLDKEVIVLLDGDRESIYSNRSERDKGMVSNRWFNTIIRNLEHHQRIKLVDMHPIGRQASDYDTSIRLLLKRQIIIQTSGIRL